MPAQNTPELYDFEGQFETAAQALLTALSITAAIGQGKDQAPLVNTGIDFEAGAATDDLTFIRPPSNWPVDREPPMEFTIYDGMLTLMVEVARDKNGASIAGVDTMLAQLRGQIRTTMMLSCMPFNPTNLPFYRVSRIKPMGGVMGSERARNIDFLRMRFAVRWCILADAWPAWTV